MIELKSFDEYPDLEKPKRLIKYVLIWCSKGNVTIVIDDKELTLNKNEVVTITSGQIHHFKKLNAAKG
ncbi:MAG: AraC family transcriptional regulator, partial [Parafilimonas sp.]